MGEGPLDLEPAVELPAASTQRAEQTEGRNERRRAEVLDRRVDRVALELRGPIDPRELAELGVALELAALLVRSSFEEFVDR